MKATTAICKKAAVLFLFVLATGCATSTTNTVSHVAPGVSVGGNNNSFSDLIAGKDPAFIKAASCKAPVKAISLAPLRCRAASCQDQGQASGNFAALVNYAREQEGIPNLVGFGDGLTDMLVSALTATGCFDVLDRELMAELASERALSGIQGNVQSADLLATGAITSLSYEKSKSVIGGGFVPVVGGVSTSKVTAKIGMDVRVIDVITGRVTYTKTYNAESGKRGFGLAGGGLIGSGILGAGHSVKGGVEIEEASRDLVSHVALDMVVQMIPEGLYEISSSEIVASK